MLKTERQKLIAFVGILAASPLAGWGIVWLFENYWPFIHQQLAPALILLVIGVLGLSVYFAPVIVAHERRHKATEAVFILNLFLGWTFLGWVGALVWAYTAPKPPRD